jgi:protein-S-isoprenylcysteine O-methyltransferase Ste14
MNQKLTYGGIGPKLFLFCLPYIVLAVIFMFRDPEFLNINVFDNHIARICGYIWLTLGFLFWAWSAVVFIAKFGSGNLIKTGPFSMCRNPIYASMILFIIPSTGVLLHSGLILSVTLVLYIGFKISIHGEAILLERNFGEEYKEYRKSVNELFPFYRSRRNFS